MKTKFGLSVYEQRLLERQVALLFDRLGSPPTREDVMKEVRALVTLCYKYGINPLPALRISYPDLDWQYQKAIGAGFDESAIRRMATGADLIWPLSEVELVVATRKKGHIDPKWVYFVTPNGRFDGVARDCFFGADQLVR